MMFSILFFLSSLLGYVHVFIYYGKQSRYIAWIQSYSLYIVLLFICSLLNKLEIGMTCVYIVGLILSADFYFKLIKKMYSQEILKYTWVDLVFLVWFLTYVFLLSKHRLIAYDNFSHWGLIVKFLYTQGHLPNATNEIIRYNSYPPGTALFINYFIHHIGYSEGNFLVAQFSLISAAFYSLFSITRKFPWFALMINFSLWGLWTLPKGSIGVSTLLVDLVMPLMSLSALIALYENRKSSVKRILSVVLICSGLVLIKNSGVFFVLVPLLTLISFINGTKNKCQTTFYSFILSFLPLILWQKHIKNTFGHVKVAKHSMTLSHYIDVLKEKDWNIIRLISLNFLKETFNLHSGLTYIIMSVFLLYLFIRIKYSQEIKLKKAMGKLIVILISYYSMLLLMYFFSMPTDEALVLASYHRYALSVIVLIYGMIGQYLIKWKEETSLFKKAKLKELFFIIATCILIVVSIPKEMYRLSHPTKEYSLDMPNILPKLTQESFNLNQKKYLLAHSQKAKINNNYGNYYGSYYLFTQNVVTKNTFTKDLNDLDKELKKYDYIVILDAGTPLINQIKMLYHVELTPGIYPLDTLQLK